VISLELRDICKSFGARDVLSGISLKVDSGCLAVTGRNGSGKSTLLRIIAGLMSPSSGEVILAQEGEAVPMDARRDLIGLVAPDLTLYEELSALENLRFFARVRGIKRSDGQLRGILGKLGLKGREDDRLGSYSSGMRQRVKYAFAMLHDPEVLLLDEPSANLDEAGISAVDAVITEHRQRGIVILATNDQHELRYGDKVLELGGS
jgi:heme exporter protein A